MLRFINREDAGNRLANALMKFKGNKDTIVVALPRGGVPVAYQVSKKLSLPLDIVAPRKIGAPPPHSEYAVGAIAENGEGYLSQDIIRDLGIPDSYIQSEMKKQREESIRRQKIYRVDRGPVNFRDKVIILVDDGIATGATIKAAIESIKVKLPRDIVVAVPVGARDSIEEITKISGVSSIECLLTPRMFGAVGCFYDNFDQTEDEIVIRLMSDKSLLPQPPSQ